MIHPNFFTYIDSTSLGLYTELGGSGGYEEFSYWPKFFFCVCEKIARSLPPRLKSTGLYSNFKQGWIQKIFFSGRDDGAEHQKMLDSQETTPT